MKLILILFLILVINSNHILAQEIKDNPNTDTLEIDSTNMAGNKELSVNASKISYNDFNKGAVFSPMQLIQGKVPGFIVNCLNVNDPNPDLQIQVRGISTLFLSTNPLYIIDGIPLESPEIIPVANINSIEVLKDLSETASYGIRGSNGVVIIKTKSNSSGPLTVSYNTYMYGEAYAGKSNYMSASEWRNLKQKWASSTDLRVVNASGKMIDYNANTDWRKVISQNKLSQAHNLGFFGGYKKTRYAAMLNYDNYNGIIQKTGNTIYSGQLSVSQLALKDKLQVDISATDTYRKYSEINDNPYLSYTDYYTGLKSSNIVSNTNQNNPTLPVYNTDGTYGIDTQTLLYNPLDRINNTTDKRELKNTLVHLQAGYEIMKGLKLSASWSAYKTSTGNIFSNYYRKAITYRQLSETKETNVQNEKLYSVKLHFNKSIAFHTIDISLDYSKQHTDINYNYRDSVVLNDTILMSRFGMYGNGDYDIKDLSGSVKYNYRNRYYLSFGILREKSPFFSSDGSAQYFPSVSATWSLKNENFLANSTWLNDLKIRTGYGTGQRMIRLAGNSVNTSNILPSRVHGEKMQEYTIGVDASLLQNRIYFSAERYRLNTKDLILISTITTNFQFSYLGNNGKIQNKGWEFYIKAKPLSGLLKWTFDFNISFNKNIAVPSNLYSYSLKFGDQPAGNFYGHLFAGYSATDRLLWYDNEGNATDVWPGNYSLLGNGAPKSFFGFTNTFEYKNFDVSINVRGGLGFEIANYALLDRYKKVLQFTDPRDVMNFATLRETDYIIEKGDYIKITDISLGYTIPVMNRFIKSAKIYMACNNVALFTGATDLDPEMAGITGLTPGYYYYERYPETRIFLLGLKVLLRHD